MKSFLRYLIFLIVPFGLWGCGQKGAKLQQSVIPPDKTLFETGGEYLEKSQFIKARLAFQTLINTYPDSELTAESYMAIGDSFYDEGGSENLLQAEDQFKNFIVFFPTHPKAADAQMKIISLNMRMMRDPDKDNSYAIKAQDALKKFINDFPDSVYIPAAKQYLIQVEDNLAQGNLMVGKFYFERENFRAAKSRMKTIVDNYPSYAAMDEAYHLLAQSLEKTENPDEAAIYYTRLATGFPHSKYYDATKARLETLGKPVPSVDTALAELNQSRVKPSQGFSPMAALTAFPRALGFIGPPDPYENAKKMVEAAQSDAAAQTASASETGKPGDVQFTTELKKSATGEVKETTVLGSSTQPVPAENGDKPKDSKQTNNSKKNDTKKKGKKS
jgi:outer membrane assembly lipoprotein YfiO